MSIWEIAIKISIGKLEQDKFTVSGFLDFCKQLHFSILDIVPQNTVSYLNLPLLKNHRDPFDRMIIATALERHYALLSRDTKLSQYVNTGLLYIW